MWETYLWTPLRQAVTHRCSEIAKVRLGCLKPMHKFSDCESSVFPVCTAELADGSQRANIQMCVAPVVVGNAENLNGEKLLMTAST